nr:uncharacterized protein LOC109157567 [Ipomoea batatas]
MRKEIDIHVSCDEVLKVKPKTIIYTRVQRGNEENFDSSYGAAPTQDEVAFSAHAIIRDEIPIAGGAYKLIDENEVYLNPLELQSPNPTPTSTLPRLCTINRYLNKATITPINNTEDQERTTNYILLLSQEQDDQARNKLQHKCEKEPETARKENCPSRRTTAGARCRWYRQRIPLLTEFSIRDRRSLSPPPSNSFNEEREVCRVEQSPERGVDDTAGAWVSTRNRRISVVDGVSHRTAQPPTVNTAFSSTAHGRFQSPEPVGAFCCQNWVAASIRH